MSTTAVPTASPASHEVDGWAIHHSAALESTNSTASHLPAWSAVRAKTQTAGRGRTGRAWVGDEGGLWLSAVLPCPGERSRWATLPLAVGWALMAALKDLGAQGLRLRWPNDLMVGHCKLAGVLVERYRDDTAVVGIGLNVHNHPEACEPLLQGQTIRLSDLIAMPYDLDFLERVVLRSLRRVHRTLSNEGFDAIAVPMNLAWNVPSRVELTLNGNQGTVDGWFQGIDSHGRLRLITAPDSQRFLEPGDVALLREID